MADKKLTGHTNLWKKIFLTIIIILFVFLFFIFTRDYEKFELLKKENGNLDDQLKLIVEATKECNKLKDESYKEECYTGISHAVGYNNFEIYPEICPNLSRLNICYKGAGKRMGEEFYEEFANNPDFISKRCESSKKWKDLCEYQAMRNTGRLLTYHNKSFAYCETIEEKYKNPCYEGVGWGLSQQYYPNTFAGSICEPLTTNRSLCYDGAIRAISEYIAKNPQHAKEVNERILRKIQKNEDLEYFLNITFKLTGFNTGLNHFKQQEIAFSICDDLSKDLGENSRALCYKSLFFGVGHAYYSDLID